MSSRADKLSFCQSTNFSRSNIYLAPGKMPEIVSVPAVTIPVTSDLLSDPPTDDMVDNSGDEDDNYFMVESVENLDDSLEEGKEETAPNVPLGEYDNNDNEIEEDEEQMRAAEELFNDLSMAEILGQTEVLNFNFLSGTNNEIEKRVREITFPRVQILEDKRDHTFIKSIICKVNKFTPKKLPKNALDPLVTSDNTNAATDNMPKVNVRQFALALNDLSATHGHSTAAVNDLLKLLRDSIPGINLPLREKDKIPFNNKAITSNTTKSYVKTDLKEFTTDICRRECMAFRGYQVIGDDPVPVDCSELMNCLVCKDPRFTKCAHKTCNTKQTEYINCNPFTRGHHSLLYRISMKKMFYRSIIVKLIELYCLSLMEGMEGILDYENRRVKKAGKVIDILDGTEVQRQQHKMKRRYQNYNKSFREQSNGMELHECSLIMTAFYDGVVNFKRKADSMWPLMISIANCNPSHRCKIGVGLFLGLLHNVSVGSGAEKFLIEDMFTQELVKLENGVVFTIPKQDGFEERHVFLQARLVFTHLDTRALEKVACVKMAGSKSCTLCNSQTGCWRNRLHKMVYGNTRISLHRRHVWRPLGQREFKDDVMPPPVAYPSHTRSAAVKAQLYYSGHPDYNSYIERDIHAAGPIDKSAVKNIHVEAFQARAVLKRSRNWNEKEDTVWYHTDPRFAPHKFLDCIRFAFPEERPQKKYRRMLNKEYMSNGRIARLRRAAAETAYAAGTKTRPSKVPDFSSAGVHDIAAIVEHTCAFKVQNFGPDPMHMFANANNNFIKCMKGDRALKDGSRQLSYSQGKHVAMQYTKWRADWECSAGDGNLVDAVINGLFVPGFYKNNFGMKNPLKQRGFLKSSDHFNYLMAYASFAMSFTDVAPDYVTFMAMYADDMCHLFDPCLSVASLPLLKKKIFETRSTQEGLYPESEQIFIFHEIVDIVNHIEKFGHLRGLMCFSGERANGQISACITKGGVNYLQTLFCRYVLKENLMLKHFILRDEDDYDNCGIYSDFALKLIGTSKFIPRFTDSAYNDLYAVVFNFLETQARREILILAASPFYRLYSAYLFMSTHGGRNSTSGFYVWLFALNKVYYSDNQNGLELYFVSLIDNTDGNFGNDDVVIELDLLSCTKGHIYLRDFLVVADSVLSSRIQSYEKVIVKGIKFACRGIDYAAPGGLHNRLKKFFSSKKHYSSIVRIRKYNITDNMEGRMITSDTIKFGWLNCAFRINMPEDKLIHGLAMAHCCQRDGVYDANRWQHSVNIDDPPCFPDSIPSGDQFVCLNYVDSSPIASSALNKDTKVLLDKLDMMSYTSKSTDHTNCYATDDQVLAQLYLIPMKPERLNFIYGDVLQDVDKTLVLENDCHFK